MGHIANTHSMRIGFIVPLVCFAFAAVYGFTWSMLYRLDSRSRLVPTPEQRPMVKDHVEIRDLRKDVMLSFHSFFSLAIRTTRGVVLTSFALSALHAQTATSPTAPGDPETIDQTWQKASSKFDAARAALLKDVDSFDHQGPYRADWESLRKYEAPE